MQILADIDPSFGKLVRHYFTGNGDTYFIPFSKLPPVSEKIIHDHLKKIATRLHQNKQFGSHITPLTSSDKLPINHDDLVYGYITYVLKGKLHIGHQKWTFAGEVRAYNDVWDFDAKEWGTRSNVSEVLTRLFNLATFDLGTPFQVQFIGGKTVYKDDTYL